MVKVKAVKSTITGLSIGAFGAVLSMLPVAAQKPAAAHTSGMAGAGKWVPADLSFAGHDCSLSLPGDSTLHEFLAPNGKVFSFNGPAHKDKKVAILNVSILPTAKGGDIPAERNILDAMLNPQRTKLKPYKEEKLPLFTNNGHSFKGMSFSGKTKDGEDRRGFVYLTQDRDTFFVLFGQDEMPYSEQSLPLLLKATKSCQIKKQ